MTPEVAPYVRSQCGISHKWNLNPPWAFAPAFRLLIPITKLQPIITARTVTVVLNPPGVPLGYHLGSVVFPRGHSKSMEMIIGHLMNNAG